MPEMLTLLEVERRHIASVLRATGNNKTKSAQILGIDRRTLYRRVRDDKTLQSEFLRGTAIDRAKIEARIAELQEQLASSGE